jgi:SdrD B-like domain
VEILEERLQPSASSAISASFDGAALRAGSTLWFNSELRVKGLGSSPVTLHVLDGEIDFRAGGTSYQVAVPNATITFSPTATAATTTFDTATDTWETTVPSTAGKVFLAGVELPLTKALPGGICPVTWHADFQTNTAGVSVNWQWAAADYSKFSTNYTALDVKPVNGKHGSAYANADRAGTPEAFKAFVVRGARWEGGRNFTGTHSATAHVVPQFVAPVVIPASLAGTVLQTNGVVPIAGVTITLTGKDVNGNAVNLVAVTDGSGNYSFANLVPGTYTLTETAPVGVVPVSATPGSVNGSTPDGSTASSTVIGQIVLAGGNKGVNYNFIDSITVKGK